MVDVSDDDTIAVTDVTTTAVMLVESWNCRNFCTASFTQQPHTIALTIEVKLSSIRMTSEASFATSVPAMPIEKLTCAVLSAGPSFVPTPVVQTATIFPREPGFSTRIFLSSGEERARTCQGLGIKHLCIIQLPKTGPSIIMPPTVKISH